MTSPFLKNVNKQFSKASKLLKLSEVNRKILYIPNKILISKLLIKSDEGKLLMFPAFRVQHNNSRGPYKGGIRFHPDVHLEEAKALALLMSLKCSIANIPLGGAKGAIKVNSKTLTDNEIKRLSKAYVHSFFNNIGPQKDIPAPDVCTNEKIMDVMEKEYSQLAGIKTPAVITGKSLKNGGSLGRESATAMGGYFVIKNAIKSLGIKNRKITVAIQGFGNAGCHIAKILENDKKFKVLAISNSKGGIYNKEGLKVNSIKKDKAGNIKNKNITNRQLLESDVDILIPAALENQITENNASKIKAKIIAELANGPVTFEADTILNKKKVMVLPDILTNAGGVVVSYFEWLQNIKNEKWTEDVVHQELEHKMCSAFDEVIKVKNNYKTTLRTASYLLAISKLMQTENLT
ncbi:Glu/Leu/Phe/Val dehydrogenase [Patescibacteria group bacterium]